MGRLKNAALEQAGLVKKSPAHTVVMPEPHDDPTDSKPVKIVRTPKAAIDRKPDRFTYALKQYSAEMRNDGWWVCRTPFGIGSPKPAWTGPFATIEDACLAIARRLATEIADRHSIHVGFYGLKTGDPLHGLKPTTRLATKKTAKASSTL